MGSASLETRTLRDRSQTSKTIQARKNNHQNITSSECKATSKHPLKKTKTHAPKIIDVAARFSNTSKIQSVIPSLGTIPLSPLLKRDPFLRGDEFSVRTFPVWDPVKIQGTTQIKKCHTAPRKSWEANSTAHTSQNRWCTSGNIGTSGGGKRDSSRDVFFVGLPDACCYIARFKVGCCLFKCVGNG